MEIKRTYGTSTYVAFPLLEPSGTDFITGATFASGDVKIVSGSSGNFANTTNLPSEIATASGWYRLQLTGTEMELGSPIAIRIVDQTPTKVWQDQGILINTTNMRSDIVAVDGSTQAAANLSDGASAMVSGITITGTLTSTAATTTISGAVTNDQYKDRTIVFLTGNLAFQAKLITGYVQSTGLLSFDAFTTAPANNDQFIIV
jgi:hypothetical protein